MKKSLLILALLIVSQLHTSWAQCNPNLISIVPGTDTVCVNQPVIFTSNVGNASTYYWGFCSGNLDSAATGSNLGKTFNFQRPRAMDVIKDSGIYYGFVLNDSSREFLELDFGNSLDNIPAVYNLGDLTKVLPSFPSSLFIVKDSDANNWYIFVAGGDTLTNSSLARLDFGHSLNNHRPNIANFGNFMNALNGPRGVFVAKEAGVWYGYLANNQDNQIVRLEFDRNISNTPLMYEEGNPGSWSNPVDMKAIWDCGSDAWYFFTLNSTSNNPLIIYPIGASLATPTYSGASPFLSAAVTNEFSDPSSMSIYKDCGYYYIYISNLIGSSITSCQFTSPGSPNVSVTNNITQFGLNQPTALSRIIRDEDKLYLFAANWADSSLSRIILQQCVNSSIPSSNAMNPPPVRYNAPGIYDVYYIMNEGQYNEQTQCAQVYVLPSPQIQFPHDTTICHPFDSVRLFIQSVDALSFTWTPNYNIMSLDSLGNSIKVWPQYSTTYNCVMPFSNGCIIDTPVHINVIHVQADAGPDRSIFDGSSTILGGPNATVGPNLHLRWFPSQFLSDTTAQYPTANPPYNYTYYQEIDTTFIIPYPLDTLDTATATTPVVIRIDTVTCRSIDTVIVYVNCNDIDLPNAFTPGSINPATNRYGLLNKGLIKLNYFKIFDRWGALQFETTDPTQKWDGTVNGKNVDQGVYVWEIDGFCSDGTRFTRKGNVTLIR